MAQDKFIAILTAKDYDFVPVVTDLADNSAGGWNGKFVVYMECKHCGKRYQWRQGLRMLRHFFEKHDGLETMKERNESTN
jgi:hypothetical protein